MPGFTLATVNLYQWARPGTWWYARTRFDPDTGAMVADDGATNPPDLWAAKHAWLAAVLADLDADVIAFQEVFSVADLRAAVAPFGYALHLAQGADPATGAEANLRPDGVYLYPHVALATRHPLAGPVRPVPFAPAAVPNGLIAPGAQFRRPPVAADIAIPGLARPLTAIAVHLKSQAASLRTDDIARLPDWPARWQAHLAQRAAADAEQIVWRTAEALSLYTHAMTLVAADPLHPLAILGDLNGAPDSVTTRILTQAERPDSIARRHTADLDRDDAAPRHRWRLHDTQAMLRPEGNRIPTHCCRHGASVLDAILVTDGLNGRNPAARARPVATRVLADAVADVADPRAASDHAPVATRFAVAA